MADSRDMRPPLRHARNRGTALVLVVVLSVVVTGLMLTLSLTVGVLAQSAGQEQHLDQAYYAAEAGLQEGDIVLSLNRQPVNNANEAVRLSEEIKGPKVIVRLWRKGVSRFVLVDESEK